MIFRVADIKVPTFDANSTDVKRLIDQLKDAYNDDLLSQYVARLESDIGTDINQNAIAQAVGRAPNESEWLLMKFRKPAMTPQTAITRFDGA